MAKTNFNPFPVSNAQHAADMAALESAEVGQEFMVFFENAYGFRDENACEALILLISRVTSSMVCVRFEDGGEGRFRRVGRKSGEGFPDTGGHIHALTPEARTYYSEFMREHRRRNFIERVRQHVWKLNCEQAEALLEVLRLTLRIAEPSREGILRALAGEIVARQEALSTRGIADAVK